MSIDEAVAKFKDELPGWWYSLADCSVSADASCGPDRAGPDADLLEHRLFDDGFHGDLRQPATVQDALMWAMEQALEARAKFKPPA
jgi:hypothetical protein